MAKSMCVGAFSARLYMVGFLGSEIGGHEEEFVEPD
jgi:hypothetical protein